MKFKLTIACVLIAVLTLSACGDDDIVVVYQARKVDPALWSHEWTVQNPTIYRIGESSVVKKVGRFVEKYNDCAIFNVDNWECSYSDMSGSVGFRDGEFWRYAFNTNLRLLQAVLKTFIRRDLTSAKLSWMADLAILPLLLLADFEKMSEININILCGLRRK